MNLTWLNRFLFMDSVAIKIIGSIKCAVFIFLLITSFPLLAGNYFQQEVNYKLKVRLDDKKHRLSGAVNIEYTNNSNDTLPYLYFHLWPNAYRDDETALAKQLIENGELQFYYSKEEDRGYIDKIDFEVEGVPAKFELDEQNKDICKLHLKKALQPGEKINISTPFVVKLPSANLSRLGHLEQSYMITQWYPKPAVYDAAGWHAMPYLNQGEFYSEFGNYEVEITLPQNYVCGASGNLLDSAEQKWLQEKSNKTNAITHFDSDEMDFPASDTTFKTLHFKAKRVHDFAWFADKRYHVLLDTITLPVSQRKVLSQVLFTNADATYWKHGSDYVKEAVLFYSQHLGEYPYDVVSIVDGTITAGAGMEYPMIAVIGNSFGLFDFEYTVQHEVGHNWFYGILGSNERDHAWMDEGMDSYYNLRYFEEKYPTKNFAEFYVPNNLLRFAHLDKYSHKTQYILSYWLSARSNKDQAASLKSTEFTFLNYGNSVYSKSASALNYLSKYLGESLFDSCMKVYYETWKFKHPQPQDFRNLIAEKSGKKLNWFFDDVMGSSKKMDYKICSIQEKDSNFIVGIKNRKNIAGPFSISAVSNKEATLTQWYEGFGGKQKVVFPKSAFSSLALDHAWDMVEINRRNNVIRRKGVFKKAEALQFQFLGSVENASRTTINFFPALGYNSHDALMAGLAFYNYSLIQKPFEYMILPLYAFGSKQLNGAVQGIYHWNGNGLFQAIEPQVKFKKYSYRSIPFALGFIKAAPTIDFTFRKKNPRSILSNSISINHSSIWEDESSYVGAEKKYIKKNYANYYYLNNFSYKLKNARAINPFYINLQVEQGNRFMKSWLEALYHFSYERNAKAAQIRIFAGKFIYQENASALFGFTMNGNNDYAYDNIYLGRNDTRVFFNQQFYSKDGSFKNLTLTSNAMNWLLAGNLFIPAPGKIPFALYSDIGKADASAKIDYDWGIALVVVRNLFEIYAPVQQSADLNQLNYFEKIRFVLHLNSLNPFEQIKNLIP